MVGTRIRYPLAIPTFTTIAMKPPPHSDGPKTRARRSRRRLTLAGLMIGLPLLLPASLQGQTLTDLFRALRAGGGWVEIPVEAGAGSVDTGLVPTAGIALSGCARVWSGHSGEWEIRAEDVVAERVIDARLGPGESVRFSHEAGMRARLRVDVRWSEPRDTTLVLWIGLDRKGEATGAACEPG